MSISKVGSVFLIAVFLTLPAWAQNAKPPKKAPAKGQQTPFAVIDVKRLFNECGAQRSGLASIKRTIDRFDKQIRARRAAIKKQTGELKKFDAGSPEYKALERDLATQASQVKIDMELKRKEVLEDEAALYAATYSSLQAACAEYCKQRGIKLVVAYDSKPINTSKRDALLKGINRRVVFQDEIDITDAVLELMKKRAQVVLSDHTKPHIVQRRK